MSTDRIVKTAILRAPHDRVWRAIADAEQFGSWFGLSTDGPFRAGARLTCSIVPTKVDAATAKAQEPYAGTSFEIVIEAIEPMSLFSFRWHPYGVDPGEPMTLVEFRLEEVPDGTRLTITESGFDRIPFERREKAFTSNEGGWVKQLELIALYLAGAPTA